MIPLYYVADLGSNIGMFTIAAALMGRSVVAVDANLYNLAYLRRSLELNSNLDQVKIVHNAMRWENKPWEPFHHFLHAAMTMLHITPGYHPTLIPTLAC